MKDKWLMLETQLKYNVIYVHIRLYNVRYIFLDIPYIHYYTPNAYHAQHVRFYVHKKCDEIIYLSRKTKWYTIALSMQNGFIQWKPQLHLFYIPFLMYPVSNILFIISWDNILVNFLYNMNLRKVLDLVTKKGFYRYLYQVS